MRIAYLDCFSGISGDMFLGALVDAGVPFELLQRTVVDLNLDAKLELLRVDRGGISAAKADVLIRGEKDLPREEFWAKKHACEAEHRRGPSHDDADKHGNAHEHEHNQGRGLKEILGIIATAPISETAKHTSSKIFEVLGRAEAKVHKVSIEDVHFHEAGAEDAIVDVVCAAVGAEAMKVQEIISSPVNVGGGTVACAHGVMPVPAPATLELLSGVPIYSGDIQKELVTPTGAAIAKVLVKRFASRPVMRTERIGYGAGSRDFAGHPNVLRISVGETLEAGTGAGEVSSAAVEEIAILEANLDDMNPQLVGYITELALSNGALDAFTAPVQMKKNRPGTLLTVLVQPEDEHKLRTLIFRESSTLGIRVRRERRYALPRHHESVSTKWGEIRMKVAVSNGTVSQYAPEYEDCRRIAAEQHLPLKTVMQEAIRQYLDQKNGQPR
jgi:uncharacterized protein (TIGR00299 family) protein